LNSIDKTEEEMYEEIEEKRKEILGSHYHRENYKGEKK